MTRVSRLALVSATAVLGVAAVTFAWACAQGGHPEVRADAWHHFYLGVGMAAWAGVRRRPGLLALAALIAVDDAWQHLTQVSGDAGYASPLKQLFAAWLWPLAPVQWVVAKLDALFALV